MLYWRVCSFYKLTQPTPRRAVPVDCLICGVIDNLLEIRSDFEWGTFIIFVEFMRIFDIIRIIGNLSSNQLLFSD